MGMSKREKLLCCRVYGSVMDLKKKKKSVNISLLVLITAGVRLRRSYCYMKTRVTAQDTAHPVAQMFL